MKKVYLQADNMVSSLGLTTREHWVNLVAGKSGIKETSHKRIGSVWVSEVDNHNLEKAFLKYEIPEKATRLERMAAYSIKEALEGSNLDLKDPTTGFIFSTTKGNVDFLKQREALNELDSSLALHSTAKKIWSMCGGGNQNPVVVCNACISGLMAIIIGGRLIRQGVYDRVVVCGADEISDFVLTGFNALKALGSSACKPFDAKRDGISLGEGCATVVLTRDANFEGIEYVDGAVSNDANHISGPSRTASGLLQVVEQIWDATEPIDFISAHGTATLYNDAMEAQGFNRLGMEDVPLNSFKGFWGHALGAAGLLETIAAVQSMKEDLLIKSLGFEELEDAYPISVLKANRLTEVNQIF
ncbi:MAG: beta-ketoacyl synthase N-terminal-like domain-containing protein, partial [Saprospiraceae bacterium]